MMSRICICCGEAMPERGSAHNPNVCSACSGMAEDLDDVDAELPERPASAAQLQPQAEEELRRAA